jgi:hypothetical protein
MVATRGFFTKSILILRERVPVGARDVSNGAAKGAGLEDLGHEFESSEIIYNLCLTYEYCRRKSNDFDLNDKCCI